MTINTLEKIKEVENEAAEIIQTARQNTEKMVLEANQNGEKNLGKAEDLLSDQLEEVINEAKKNISSAKAKSERELNNELQKLQKIDNRIIDQAADIVIRKIIK